MDPLMEEQSSDPSETRTDRHPSEGAIDQAVFSGFQWIS